MGGGGDERGCGGAGGTIPPLLFTDPTPTLLCAALRHNIHAMHTRILLKSSFICVEAFRILRRFCNL